MNETTEALGLALPKPDDYYDIEVFNDNARLLDAEAARVLESIETLREQADAAHAELQAYTEQNEAQLIQTDNAVTAHAARLTRLEEALFNNVTQNPFMITFGTLDAVSVAKGVWNTARQRLEC